MERTAVFKKNRFNEFFSLLKDFGPVFAPQRVSLKSFSFKEVNDPSEIAFEALRTILPPKKFFFQQRETIIAYDEEGIREVKPSVSPQVLFGLHPCDLAGLGIMDKVYSATPPDPHYLARRQATMLIGLSCMPDKHCFCKSMGTDAPTSDYDLFLTDIGDEYFVQIHSALGMNLVESKPDLFYLSTEDAKQDFKDFWTNRDKAFTAHFESENLPAIMDMEWDSKVWDDLGNRCLSCGNCTPVCPTCYCFDMVDVASLHSQQGERVREWDSCQFVGFAKVAGDMNFRPGPVDRLKFWYRHKLHGFEDPHGLPTCVGCGRCTESCPAGIDDIVNVVLRLQGKPSILITDKDGGACGTKNTGCNTGCGGKCHTDTTSGECHA
jgi:sulfhydrogenase subunit beta (sulfur reductase)